MRIKTLRTFSGVPAGTEGECERDADLWKVTWYLPNRAKPLVDWFRDDEKKQYLQDS